MPNRTIKTVQFVPDSVVNAPRTRGRRRNTKYSRLLQQVARRSGEWGIVLTTHKIGSAYGTARQLRERWGVRADGTPYMEFKVFRNPTKSGVSRWSVVARLPQDNAL